MKQHEAKSQLAELEAKLLAHQAKAGEHEAAIAAVSLPAQTGDASARKRLDKLVAETPAIDTERRSLEYAIKAAKERVTSIAAADLDAAERDKAGQALAMVEAFRKRGAALDVAFDAAIAEFGALERDFRALDLLGYAPSTWNLVKINLQLAAATKLQLVNLQQNFLAPRERRDFVGAISGWADNVARRARARIERDLMKGAA
ncbi:MAG: hypothetical protein WAL59_27905 [Roseiarcus sp.]